jgi:hypothetical protein
MFARYLIIASQDDSFQVGENLGHAPSGTAQLDYVAGFANRTRAGLRSLQAARPSTAAVFSWACFNHCTSTSPSGFNTWTAGSSKTTMNDALVQVLGWDGDGRDGDTRTTGRVGAETNEGAEEGGEAGAHVWVDSCDGWRCGGGC